MNDAKREQLLERVLGWLCPRGRKIEKKIVKRGVFDTRYMTSAGGAYLNEKNYQKLMSCETEYFFLKWFRNGTARIEFKRMDLVHELNIELLGRREKKR
jgi:hypothetical protein